MLQGLGMGSVGAARTPRRLATEEECFGWAPIQYLAFGTGPGYPNHTNRTVPKAVMSRYLVLMDLSSELQAGLPMEPRPDRRDSVRFPLPLTVRYSASHRRALVETGSGQIIDLSSSGLRIAGHGPLKAGLKLDVAINWPVLLDGHVQLQLIVAGVVIWSSETEIALRFRRHDFRTRRAEPNGALR
jgi:PilZ domain